MTPVTITGIARDEGTVVVFDAYDDERNEIQIAVDHRPAQALADALAHGEFPEADVDDWQIIV